MVVLSFMMTSEFFGLDFGLLVRLAIRKYILIIFWSKKYRNETIAGEKIIVSVSGYCHSGHSSHSHSGKPELGWTNILGPYCVTRQCLIPLICRG